MAVKHTFVSAKADSADPTLVNASNWNANHTIDNDTITYALLQNVSATQRVLGRNTAGAGDPEEVTASQLFDWVSSTNGVLLTRAAGTWGAAANVTIDNGDIVLAENASPVTPAAAKVKIFGRNVAGRTIPAWADPNGRSFEVQPHIGRCRPGIWAPRANATTAPDSWGINAPSATGTLTARNVANTSLATATRREAYVSAATAGSAAGARSTVAQWLRGDTGDNGMRGGFHMIARFMISDAVLVATANMFVGLQASAAAPTDVDPATLTNIIGVGCTNGDTQMQLYAAGAAAQTRTALGANFPVNTVTTDVYEVQLYAPPNGADIRYLLTRLNTGHTVSGTISAGANLPSTTQLLTVQMWRSNGGTASAVGLDFIWLYIDAEGY
jgi:hypothetical protein